MQQRQVSVRVRVSLQSSASIETAFSYASCSYEA